MSSQKPTDDDDANKLPDFEPLPPAAAGDEEFLEAKAATEPGDINPVFGGNVQPQKVLDADFVGNETSDPPDIENTAANFDPENDLRMQPEAEEE